MKSLLRPLCHLMILGAGMTIATSLNAQATVEGVVSPIPQPNPPPTDSRYHFKPGQVATAAKPVAIVYLEGATGSRRAGKANVMGQKGYQFEHFVLPVQTGTQVEFPNYDEDYHNVFSLSRVKRFDLGRYRKGETPPALTFDKPGVVRLYCEIHKHMRGVILVLDTPYFVTTSAEGKYRLTGLPAGSYTLKAWLDEKTILSSPVTIKSGQTLRMDFGGKTRG